MAKEFNKWLLEFNEIREEMKSTDSSAWNKMQSYGQNEKDLLFWYIQYHNDKETKSLVRATWILAILTMILASTSIWLAIKA